MKEYLICSVFWCIFTLMLYTFGKVIKRDSKSFSESLIWGYIVYSMLIAVVGMPMQILNLPWIVFGVYVGINFPYFRFWHSVLQFPHLLLWLPARNYIPISTRRSLQHSSGASRILSFFSLL